MSRIRKTVPDVLKHHRQDSVGYSERSPDKKRLTGLSIFVILIVLAGLMIFYEPAVEEGEAVRPINIVFNFEPQDEAEAARRDGNIIELRTGPTIKGSGQANVTGYVSIYRSAKLEKAKVFVNNLRIRTSNPDLIGSVFPSIAEFSPGLKAQQIPLKVNLQISRTTRYSTGPNPLINVTVLGEWVAKYEDPTSRSSGTIEPYPLYVNVRPYHFLTMSFDPPLLQLMPGSTGYVDCIVMNQGNGFERVEMMMPGQLAYAKAGWVIEMESTVMNIDPSSEERIRIKITSPREFKFKWHRTLINFPLYALSHYSKYQVKDLELDYEYQSQTYDIQVQLSGFDFVYVPYVWAVVFWIVIALVLFNTGVNPLVMRKRNLPPGKEPGFVALYHFANSPKRRERWKQRREEKREARKLLKEEKAAQKLAREKEAERLKGSGARSEELDLSERGPKKRSRPVLDLKRQEDDFDIEIPEDESPGKAKPLLPIGKPRSKSKREKKGKELEKEMLDVLEHLDE
ncbi:MAG: hypothetical protein R6V01_00165 [Thermoplasmatota archaeon]